MGISKAGLARFKEVALWQKNAPLLVLFLTDPPEKYGYVREISADNFVFEEIQIVTMEKKDSNGQTTCTERYIEKMGHVTIPLARLLNWAVIPPSALTSQSKVVFLRKSVKDD